MTTPALGCPVPRHPEMIDRRVTTSNPEFRQKLAWGVVWTTIVFATGCVPTAESDVVVYSAADQEFARPILQAFERGVDHDIGVAAKYDIESTKTVGLANQILAEFKTPVADVFWNNEVLHTIRLQQEGILASRNWKLPPGFPSDMRARDGTWCGFAARARVLIVNTERLPDRDQWPRSVDELMDPKWKDRCGMARPLFGTTATHFAVRATRRGIDETLSDLKTIADNAAILSGNKQVALSVSSGSLDWGLTDTDDAIIEKDGGYPVEIVFPDQGSSQVGTLRIPNTVAVLQNAPHPVAAGRLADHLVSPETEERLAMGDSSQIPLFREVEFPPRVLPRDPVRWMKVDFEAAAEIWPTWIEQVDQVLGP